MLTGLCKFATTMAFRWQFGQSHQSSATHRRVDCHCAGKTPWVRRGKAGKLVGWPKQGKFTSKMYGFRILQKSMKIRILYGFCTGKYAPVRQSTPLVRVELPVRTQYVFDTGFACNLYVLWGTGDLASFTPSTYLKIIWFREINQFLTKLMLAYDLQPWTRLYCYHRCVSVTFSWRISASCAGMCMR